MNISEIPLQDLLKDKDESIEDIKICEKALRHDIKNYSGGSVRTRLEVNIGIVNKINDELARRNVAIIEKRRSREE